MASDLEKHMTFVVSDDKEANASTNINNVITVNLGLLKYVENELVNVCCIKPLNL